MNITFFVTLATSIIAIFITYYLNNERKYGPVKASVYSSYVVSLAFYIINLQIEPTETTKIIPLVFFGASFVGMSNNKHLSTTHSKLIVSLIFSIIFANTRNIYVGFGGGLGSIAFISVISTTTIFQIHKLLFNKLRRT